MASPSQQADRVADRPVDRHGPLPSFLLVLTAVTGLVDAVSYLKLGHVFVANMTGNIVFLGLAAAGATDFSLLASLAATVAFLAGALLGGRLGSKVGRHRGRFLAAATYAEVVLIAAALLISLLAPDSTQGVASMALIVLMALAMGLQNATARRLGVPDLTTTVLTLTLTALAADSRFGGGANPNPGRRLAATATMCLGAAVGTLLVFHAGVSAVFALAAVLLATIGTLSQRTSTSSEPWTVGA
jgi:uncharacterized membrane protein YoaK (UPF0700 family)